MSRRQHPSAERAALSVFRAAHPGPLLSALPALLALAVHLCIAGTPDP
ncbi:hypothetical protein [Streptomyces sp. PSAA01]|nr:hypothetical protein [Streptomyces sp. PSAA01]MCG0289847.1 hypothetical protein [Streptomyces sp. PSAA01]